MSRTNQKEASQMKSHYTVQDLTKMALLTALISVSAYINIPLPFSPVTITAQTLVVNMIALLLTPRQAGFCILVYSLLGLVGLPVFSGGVGGPGKLFGPSGGYIFSWLPAVMLMSALKGRNYHFIRYCAVTIFVGMPVIYSIGTVYMKYFTGMNWMAALSAAVIPFIPLDLFKCIAAVLIARPVQVSLVRSVGISRAK